MTPENVPDELLALYGRNYEGGSNAEAERRALASVLTEHERLVREQVAREIEERVGKGQRPRVERGRYLNDLEWAVRVARGETR